MRRHAAFLAVSVYAMILCSCSTPPAFGHVDNISAADMEAAVSAFRAATRPDAEVGAIEVITHNAIRIYQATERRNYTTMVREKGKWHVGDVVLAHPAYLSVRSNQALERTATRFEFTFEMTKTFSIATMLALGGGRSACSR